MVTPMGEPWVSRALSVVFVVSLIGGSGGCFKLDGFLFAGEPLTLEDYDFTTPDFDGIDTDRITSELVQVGETGEQIHVIFVERDLEHLDPRIDPNEGVTVVFSEGNRENIAKYWYRAGYFEDMGFNVLMYDYRGYGASDGETSEESTYQDAVAAYDAAVTREEVGAILSFGYSMGGGPTLFLCSPESKWEVLGCVTESAFASTELLFEEGLDYSVEGSWFLDVAYENAERAATLEVPYLLMHGTLDQRVSIHHGEAIWAAVRDRDVLNRFFIIDGAGHRNVPIPSYPGSEEPSEYSHPDELPSDLRVELSLYQARIIDFVVDVLDDPSR